jgi:hypothetical protein
MAGAKRFRRGIATGKREPKIVGQPHRLPRFVAWQAMRLPYNSGRVVQRAIHRCEIFRFLTISDEE